jgi:hypothetical protein
MAKPWLADRLARVGCSQGIVHGGDLGGLKIPYQFEWSDIESSRGCSAWGVPKDAGFANYRYVLVCLR